MSEKYISIIGFGEVGQTLAEDLLSLGVEKIKVWDISFSDPSSIPSNAANRFDVEQATSAENLIADASIVISAVTAEQTLNAVKSCFPAMEKNSYYMDVNSASPEEKKRAAEIINGTGAKYIEASIMSPIFPKRIKAPILLSGKFADEFVNIAYEVGFTGAKSCSDKYGVASATKMCRSVIVKGVESLLSESLLTARHYGVEDSVLKSLGDLFPGPDWGKIAPYMISRSLMHGKRRAEEMREVMKTVADAGVEPIMSEACSKRQDWASIQKTTPNQDNLCEILDSILSDIKHEDVT
jgi:3-hydroxyisobutyrate dehydrogenase-like beta-hydroxyacid dehydrogenase